MLRTRSQNTVCASSTKNASKHACTMTLYLPHTLAFQSYVRGNNNIHSLSLFLLIIFSLSASASMASTTTTTAVSYSCLSSPRFSCSAASPLVPVIRHSFSLPFLNCSTLLLVEIFVFLMADAVSECEKEKKGRKRDVREGEERGERREK